MMQPSSLNTQRGAVFPLALCLRSSDGHQTFCSSQDRSLLGSVAALPLQKLQICTAVNLHSRGWMQTLLRKHIAW
jgi:hypothetical protein